MIGETWGLLLAAGRGRRMGGGKQLLPWPPENPSTTLVATSFDALNYLVSRMAVALGHRRVEVVAALADREFERLEVDPDAEMIESIKAGLRWLLSRDAAKLAVVHPADQPIVNQRTFSELMAYQHRFPTVAVMPEFGERGGHPVLIPRLLWPRIMACESAGGLRQFWADHPSMHVRVPVNDPMVIADFDCLDDLARGVHTDLEKPGDSA